MNTIQILIYTCGIHSIALAIFHVLFWRLFNWKRDLQNLSFANRAIMQILNCRLIYFFLFTAFVCFFYSEELVTTSLGKVFLGGLSLFWLGRTVEQVIFLGYKNKYVNLLTVIFVIGAILFALPLFLQQ
jgi:hypothetical protein